MASHAEAPVEHEWSLWGGLQIAVVLLLIEIALSYFIFVLRWPFIYFWLRPLDGGRILWTLPLNLIAVFCIAFGAYYLIKRWRLWFLIRLKFRSILIALSISVAWSGLLYNTYLELVPQSDFPGVVEVVRVNRVTGQRIRIRNILDSDSIGGEMRTIMLREYWWLNDATLRMCHAAALTFIGAAMMTEFLDQKYNQKTQE